MTPQKHSLTVQKVALFLGPSWRFDHRDESNFFFRIIGEGGRALLFRVDGKKFIISGFYPKNKTISHYTEEIKIGVTATRPPRDIARDIERRLLNQYFSHFVKAQEKYNKRAAEKQEINNLCNLLLKFTKGTKGYQSRGEMTIHLETGKITIFAENDISLSLRQLSPTQAIQLLTLAKKSEAEATEVRRPQP